MENKYTISESEFNEGLWRRAELEQLLGYDACRRLNLTQGQYWEQVNVQLELRYPD